MLGRRKRINKSVIASAARQSLRCGIVVMRLPRCARNDEIDFIFLCSLVLMRVAADNDFIRTAPWPPLKKI